MGPRDDQDQKKSKSQLKRDMELLRRKASKLLLLPQKDLEKLKDSRLVESLAEAKKIHKSSAKNRHIQYLAKLLKSIDPAQVAELIDKHNSSTVEYKNWSHNLEQWRSKLISDTSSTMQELLKLYPCIDRKTLKKLVKKSIVEQETGDKKLVYYRKLFKFLKALEEKQVNQKLMP